MSMVIYLVGYLIFIAGIAWALSVAGISHLYITIACVILLGLGILTGVTKTRSKDRST
jgi:energy-converting hydrogenase Eha subunit G